MTDGNDGGIGGGGCGGLPDFNVEVVPRDGSGGGPNPASRSDGGSSLPLRRSFGGACHPGSCSDLIQVLTGTDTDANSSTKGRSNLAFNTQVIRRNDGPKLLAMATMTGNQYKLDLHSDSETALLAKTADLWHFRLAQIQPSTILEISKSKSVQGLTISSSHKSDKSWSGCVLGKAHRNQIPKQSQS